MLCQRCGKEIGDGAKFCPFCGAVYGAGASPQPSAGPAFGGSAPAPGASGGKSRKNLFIIGGAAAAALAAVALIIAVVMGAFRSPKEQVGYALAQTFSAYSGVADALDLPDLGELSRERSMSQSLRLTLGGVNGELIGAGDLSALKGIGLRVDADYSHGDRKLDCDLALLTGGEDLLSLQLLLDNNNLYLASEELTRGDAYGLDTETVGAGLNRIVKEGGGQPDPDLKDVGFNVFDLMDILAAEERRAEMEQAVKDAALELAGEITVEKNGDKSIQVNGRSVKAAAYRVEIPGDALEDWADRMEDAFQILDTQDTLEAMLEAMGLPDSAIDQLMSGMGEADLYGYRQLGETLKRAAEALGDVELDVYLSGGYVTAVEYADRIDGEKVELSLYLGGGGEYVDDLSLELTVGDTEITLESSGDHKAKNGAFTDETTLRVREGASDTRLGSEARYEVSGGGLTWELDINGLARLELEGQLSTTKDSLKLQDGTLTLRAAGTKLLDLDLEYAAGPCNGMRVSAGSPTMVSDMDWEELQDLVDDIEGNAESWVRDLLFSGRLNGLYQLPGFFF